jgi:transcriptional regulator with XRE-family HTH domain
MTIGSRIQRARKAFGASQAALADAIGVTQAAVSGWESDKRQPDNSTLGQIADHLGVTPGYLAFSDSGGPLPGANMTIGSRIRDKRKALKLTQRALAEIAGVDVTTVTRWELDKFRPDEDALSNIANLLNVSPSYLAFGESSAIMSAQSLRELPIIGRVEAGAWREALDLEKPLRRVAFVPHPSFPPEVQVGFEVRGESCNQVLKDGEDAVAVPYNQIPGGMDALLARNEPALVVVERVRAGFVEATVKELRKVNGEVELWPRSDDPDHQDKITLNENGDTDEVRIAYVVVRAIRSFF